MKLRHIYTLILMPMACVVFPGCEKDLPASEEVEFTTVKVYNDTGIAIPMEVVAGKGNLLCVYHASSAPEYRFMLTDNNGKHLWTKDFGLNSAGGRIVTGLVAEEDGTFSIFSYARMINIDAEGNVLKDDPDFLTEIASSFPTKVIINRNGNYFFYGMNSFGLPNYGLACEITHSGVTVFKKVYTVNTLFTGCQQTSDGGYLFLGSSFSGINASRFFICKMSATGNVDWIKYHTPPGPGYNPDNYCFFTHDIIATSDGNYLCFVGSTDPEVDNTSRIYKVDPDGELLDSIDVNFAAKNMFVGGNENNSLFSGFPTMNGYCTVKRPDGTYAAFLNNGKLEEVIHNTTALRGSQTFRINFNDDLAVKHISYLQNSYADYLSSVCTTSDGKIASFGYISSFGGYNKPIIIISE